MKEISIFISSPGDVIEERTIALQIIHRLQSEYFGRYILEPIFWEYEPILSTTSFQEQILSPSKTDIFVCILWSRMGTPLSDKFKRADGSKFISGTQFEFEDAFNHYRKTGKPKIITYRKTAEPLASLRDRELLLEKLQQKESLEKFFKKWFYDPSKKIFTGGYHSFETSDQFGDLLDIHLSKLIKDLIGEPFSPLIAHPTLARWQKGSPFRGLQMFDIEHSPIFFGRNKAIAEILNALRSKASDGYPFILILGESGSGKSSLARAGVIPMLTKPGIIEVISLWRIAIMRPGSSSGNLFASLASALIREEALPELFADGTGIDGIVKTLEETPEAINILIKGGLSQAAAQFVNEKQLSQQPAVRLVLLIDQLEEIFTHQNISPEDRMNFFNLIETMTKGGQVWVIATLRSDFYQRCSEIGPLVRLKQGSGQYDLLSPTAAELGQMIRQPALAAGLHFEENLDTKEHLDDMLLNAAIQNPMILPLLEFALEELYKQKTNEGMLTFSAYQKLAGLEGALAKRAEEVFSRLDSKVQSAFNTIMQSLVNIDDTDGRETISRNQADLEIFEGSPESKSFVNAFTEARIFVTLHTDDNKAVVTVAHEALFHHWPRLKTWIEQNKEILRIHSRLSAATTRWQQEQKSKDFLLNPGKQIEEAEELLKAENIKLLQDEETFIKISIKKVKRARRVKQVAVTLIAVLGIVAILASIRAIKEMRRAELEAERAEDVVDGVGDMFEKALLLGKDVNSITLPDLLESAEKSIAENPHENADTQIHFMNYIANLYIILGLYDKASSLIETALDYGIKKFGKEHPRVISSIGRLARIYYEKGQLEQAEHLQNELLERRRKVYGRGSEEVANSLYSIAVIQASYGHYNKAEKYLREELKIREKLMGKSNAWTAFTRGALANVLRGQGKIAEAESLFIESLNILNKHKDDEQFDLAHILSYYAAFKMRKKEFDQADSLCRLAIKIYQLIVAGETPRLNSFKGTLAEILSAKKEYHKADSLFHHKLNYSKKIYGEEHYNTALDYRNLGLNYYRQNNYDDAEKMYRKATDIFQKVLPPDHFLIDKTRGWLGLILMKQKKNDEAEPLLVNSFQQIIDRDGEVDESNVRLLNGIIELYENLGETEKVLKYQEMLPDSLKN